MLKNILKLDGAQQLSKTEQKSIKGGYGCGVEAPPCKKGYHCDDLVQGICVKN